MAIGYLDDKYLQQLANVIRKVRGQSSSTTYNISELQDNLCMLHLSSLKSNVKIFSRNISNARVYVHAAAAGGWLQETTTELSLPVTPNDISTVDANLYQVARGVEIQITPANGYKFEKYSGQSYYIVASGVEINRQLSTHISFYTTSATAVVEINIVRDT